MEKSEVFDVPQLRSKLQSLIAGTGFYPAELEALFPRILNEIVLLWGKPELDIYLNGLMVTERTDRQGFPDAVASEIFRLSTIHGAFGLSQGQFASGWAGVNEAHL